jgi:hypothetical protein
VISDEAVEAAAQAIYRLACVEVPTAPWWENVREGRRNGYRKMARGALDAAEAVRGEAGRERSPEPPASASLRLGGHACPDRTPHREHWWSVAGVRAPCPGVAPRPLDP